MKEYLNKILFYIILRMAPQFVTPALNVRKGGRAKNVQSTRNSHTF